MFRRITLAVLIIGCLGNAWAEPPAPSKPEPHPITLSGPTAAPIRLSPDVWLVADYKTDVIPRSSQVGTGRVKFTVESGPIKLRGRFATGNGGIETRTFPGPYVIVIEAETSGPCECLLIPKGCKDAAEIVAIALDVAMDPIPPPVPQPEDELVSKLKAAETDKEAMAELAATYRVIVGRLEANDKAMDKIATWSAYKSFITDAREQAIKERAAKGRDVLTKYFDVTLVVSPDGKFDSSARKKAAAALSIAATALEKASK